MKYIYGPVTSWRLGSSLGIDLLSQKEKICNFNCLYCQLGENTSYSIKRNLYVSTEKVIEELEKLPVCQIDYITFSGRGEPTLAKNLGETIRAIKKFHKEPIVVITNSSLMKEDEVREELLFADCVIAKLDIPSQKLLKLINKPARGIQFEEIYHSLVDFRKEYAGKLALQIMVMDENKKIVDRLARLSLELNPDEVQINTPLRPCRVKPLLKEEIFEIKGYFKGLKTISVYDKKIHKVKPISYEETLLRRGEG